MICVRKWRKRKNRERVVGEFGTEGSVYALLNEKDENHAGDGPETSSRFEIYSDL